jgi:two-component system, chemotaxis family, chemotaxis protein CheY
MPATSKSEIAPLHILVVDDDQSFLMMMQAMLASLGVTHITQAANGSDAYAKLVNIDKVVDCILCDFGMNSGNGLQLLQAVRMGKIKVLRPDTCFILVTASGQPHVVEAAGRLDANGYLVKPVTPAKIEAAVIKGRQRPVRLDFAKYNAVTLPRAT